MRHFVLAAALLAPAALHAQSTIAAATQGMERRDGFVPVYWSAAKGRLYVEVPRTGEDFLYLRALATGLGAGGPDIDRGRVGDEAIVRWERSGNRVLLVQQNHRFTASAGTPALARSVRESFPTAVLASLEVVAEEGGRLVADATPLVTSDALDLRGELRENGEGTFVVDPARSTVWMERTRAFPRNTELEGAVTFTSDNMGRTVRRHSPDGRAVTFRIHHSFVQLPDSAGFRPRRFDPRMGFFAVNFMDFARKFDEDHVTRYIVRHRLRKRDPNAAVSAPVEPIVYYLDPAVPEPYRSNFKQGAMWWAKAFEAAGFRDAFRVEDMPLDMDPLDARYHVIQWVHRSQPSSSWGSTYTDPRTGEIIKAAVRMDSHRSVANYNLFAGTIPAGATSGELGGPLDLDARWLASLRDASLGDTSGGVTAEQFVMARRRQHSAHEVGHTLGLAHNFIAHANGRASAMDYPPPLVKVTNGKLDLTDAYREGLGAYDTLAIRWGYGEWPTPEAEKQALAAIANEGMQKGILFMTNSDEALGGAHPEVTTWVTGSDIVEELARTAEVRKFLLQRFDERAIQPGEPMWLLQRRLAQVYMHHGIAAAGAVKAIGGMEWRYALRGDPLPPTRMVPAARQQRALGLLMDVIQPASLAIPERVLAAMPPRPFGYTDESRLDFAGSTAPVFDHLGLARSLATSVVRGLLTPERAARVVAFHDRDPRMPSLGSVVGTLVARTWIAGPSGESVALRRVVQRVTLDELLRLAADPRATPDARAAAEWGLRQVKRRAMAATATTPDAEAHRDLAVADVDRFLGRRDPFAPRPEPARTPGTSLGSPDSPTP